MGKEVREKRDDREWEEGRKMGVKRRIEREGDMEKRLGKRRDGRRG